MVRRILAGSAGAALLLLTGCTSVEPWERGTLAKPEMALDPNAVHTALRVHKFTSREAASGGDAATGGGCGCN
jgi:hypothetical protein